jgi:hypothetical protein
VNSVEFHRKLSIAFSAGPNYNKAWIFFDKQDLAVSTRKANDAIARASEMAVDATATERGLIKALAARFSPTDNVPQDFGHLNRAYADAMRPVYQTHSQDVDVAALYAEALMCITPRGLWDLNTGKPTGSHTIEAREVIETAFKTPKGFTYLAHCHLYIHLLEMCPTPELALPAADRLRPSPGRLTYAAHAHPHRCCRGRLPSWRRLQQRSHRRRRQILCDRSSICTVQRLPRSLRLSQTFTPP